MRIAKLRLLVLTTALAVTALSAAPVATRAAADDLEGTWSGGGTLIYTSGEREKARCRATISRSSSTSYRVHGNCATQSGKATQVAEVFKTGANRYRGDFHNPEFDISGSISVVVHGRSLTATLRGTNGAGGVLKLSH
jgi:uncharacterized protein (DUF2147 family)